MGHLPRPTARTSWFSLTIIQGSNSFTSWPATSPCQKWLTPSKHLNDLLPCTASGYYHCDNGWFADNNFKLVYKQSNQRLTFCGVNAHFQNGIAERAIRDLSESVRKQLLHACQCWPQVVSIALRPYALHDAAHLHNILPVLKDGRSRLEMFSSIWVGSSIKTLHTLGALCLLFTMLTQETCQSHNGSKGRALSLILDQVLCMHVMCTWYWAWQQVLCPHSFTVALMIFWDK